MKTAGTSIEALLSEYCGENDVVTPIYPPLAHHQARNHRGFFNPLPETLEHIKSLRVWRCGRTIRNLIDRCKFYNHVPAYVVRARVPAEVWTHYYKFCVERNPWDKTLSHFHMMRKLSKSELTFEQYLRNGRFCRNYPLYTDAGGDVIIVDQIVRYETLAVGLADVFGRLGIPFSGKLEIYAKNDYRDDRRPYQEILTTEQCDFISNKFHKEIALLGCSS